MVRLENIRNRLDLKLAMSEKVGVAISKLVLILSSKLGICAKACHPPRTGDSQEITFLRSDPKNHVRVS